MTARTSYAPGTPSWVDVVSPDVDAAASFYRGLFGWNCELAAAPAEGGGYRLFTLRGRNVAGLGPVQGEGQLPLWTTYVSVYDADAAARHVAHAGGQVAIAPVDVLDAGRMAYISDPLGATLALWQPRGHIGAELVNETATLCWNELAARDVARAKAFYEEVFGWQGNTRPFEGSTYTEWELAGETVGGMVEMNHQWPAEVPPHWMVYFAVADPDATAARAGQLGGRVSVPPTDIPAGRFAVLNDRHGATFSIIRLAQPPG